MQTKWIEDLLAIAGTQSFSRAAEIRSITQSALSRRIRSLEEWVGAELVDRGTYPVQLTTAGKTFCDEGKETLAALNDLRSTLRLGERMPGKSIGFTVGHTLSMTFLPKWLMDFQRMHGHFNARVVAANVHDAVVALAEGSCDLMIGYHHPQAPIVLDPDKFDSLTLGTDAFIPVCAPDSRGNPLFKLPGTAKKPIPYLAYTSTTHLRRVTDVLLKHAKQPCFLQTCYEGDMAMQLMKMAIEGYGVAWLPESSVAEEIERGRIVRAGDARWSGMLEIRSYRSVANANPTMQELWKSLEKDSR